MFDLPIAILAFILLVYVVLKILISARNSSDEPEVIEYSENDHIVRHSNKKDGFGYRNKKAVGNIRKKVNKPVEKDDMPLDFNDGASQSSKINKSSQNIKFESNDLLDDFKK